MFWRFCRRHSGINQKIGDRMISIRPKYFSQFKCDGKSCSSRCCKGWRIVIDESIYTKYHDIKDEVARQEILSKIERLDDNKYVVKMKEDLSCPFLDEDYLCKLQKRYGEDYLAAICYSYPRVNYKFGDILEQSLNLTCPIAAKLILLSNISLEFEEVDIETPRGIFDRTARIKMPIEKAVAFQANAVSILQDRNCSFNERLLRLCILLQDEPFVGKMNLNFDIDSHIKVMIDIFSKMYDANMSEEKKAQLTKIYIGYNKIILQRLLENYAHIFENYLVNEFFMRCYPFAFEGGLWENCRIFITGYKVMEFALILTAISKNGFVTTEEFLTMIDAVNEKIDHNRNGMKAIIEFAKSTTDLQEFTKLMLSF